MLRDTPNSRIISTVILSGLSLSSPFFMNGEWKLKYGSWTTGFCMLTHTFHTDSWHYNEKFGSGIIKYSYIVLGKIHLYPFETPTSLQMMRQNCPKYHISLLNHSEERYPLNPSFILQLLQRSHCGIFIWFDIILEKSKPVWLKSAQWPLALNEALLERTTEPGLQQSPLRLRLDSICSVTFQAKLLCYIFLLFK